MRVAIYARVSTSDKEQDPETQLMALRDYCGAHDVVVYDDAMLRRWSTASNYRSLVSALVVGGDQAFELVEPVLDDMNASGDRRGVALDHQEALPIE